MSLGSLALAACLPGRAWAVLELVPYGSAQLEHHDNLLKVSSPERAEELTGARQESDTVTQERIGVESTYSIGRQTLRLDVEGRRLQYANFSNLDHSEHTISALFRWKLGGQTAGQFDYEFDRHLASFEDLNSADMILQTERRMRGTVEYDFTPEWHFESGLTQSRYDLPLPDDPEFAFDVTYGTFALKYQNQGALTPGVQVEVRHGTFRIASVDNAYYDQPSIDLTLDYRLSEVSRLNLTVGRTQRSQSVRDFDGVTSKVDVTGVTGTLHYTRTISVKTYFDLGAYRRVDNYLVGSAPMVATGLSVQAGWSPTRKIKLTTRGEFERSSFQGDGAAATDATVSNRGDRRTVATVDLNYQALRWLGLRPYLSYLHRSSNIETRSYEDSVVGAELLLRLE